MSVQLLDWEAVKRAEIERLAVRDAALGVMPILVLVELLQ